MTRIFVVHLPACRSSGMLKRCSADCKMFASEGFLNYLRSTAALRQGGLTRAEAEVRSDRRNEVHGLLDTHLARGPCNKAHAHFGGLPPSIPGCRRLHKAQPSPFCHIRAMTRRPRR